MKLQIKAQIITGSPSTKLSVREMATTWKIAAITSPFRIKLKMTHRLQVSSDDVKVGEDKQSWDLEDEELLSYNSNLQILI